MTLVRAETIASLFALILSRALKSGSPGGKHGDYSDFEDVHVMAAHHHPPKLVIRFVSTGIVSGPDTVPRECI